MKFTKFIPAIFWFATSLVLLCLPGSKIPKSPFLTLIHADKWVHICMSFGLCFLFSWPFSSSNLPANSRKKWFLLITLSGILYGTIMEFVQKYWIPNRSFELLDIVADSIGCLLAWVYSWKRLIGKQ